MTRTTAFKHTAILSIAAAVSIAAVTSVTAQSQNPTFLNPIASDTDARDLKPFQANRPSGQRPQVSMRATQQTVAIGDAIGFEVRSSIDGYGHLYVLSASGRVQLWMENVPISGGRTHQFPHGQLGIKASAPAGREDVVMVVTRARLDGFGGRRTTSTPQRLSMDHDDFKQALDRKLADLNNRDWGATRSVVRVVENRQNSFNQVFSNNSQGSSPWSWMWRSATKSTQRDLNEFMVDDEDDDQ